MAGAELRFWGLPRLGLSHFDEGIYAIAGLWSVSPRGLASLDPTLIPYAPPGFPILVGVAYRALGVSDLAAILVSILAGTLTIPAAAWLARRTSGAGAGAAAAALVAFSGFHVAFSRVALTDASFLLCWILGLVCGQRFLERPRFSSAIALGLSVGLVQWFKYNGWLLGVFVVLAACLGILVDPKERHRPRSHPAIERFTSMASEPPPFIVVNEEGCKHFNPTHHPKEFRVVGQFRYVIRAGRRGTT